jgi:methionine aminopeptidase
MGVHLDGYITVTANTVIVGHDPNTPTTGPLADVFTAAWACAEVAARMITPGAANTDVTAAMKRICEAYDVRPLSGSVMHQVKRYVIDGNKNIGMHDNVKDEGKVEKCKFNIVSSFAIMYLSLSVTNPLTGDPIHTTTNNIQQTTTYRYF